jgi:hypothetical protein
MQLARMGEIGAMQNLFTAKKSAATYRDEEGITPLHVRSILCAIRNNRRCLLTFRFLFLVGRDQQPICDV